MSSGAGVSDECVTAFQELKLSHSLRYVVFKLNDDFSEVIVEKKGENRSCEYSEFTDNLPEADCRYAIYDYEYDFEGGKRSKILFVVWAPDAAKIKSKMLYASTKDIIRKKFVGIGVEIQATDIAEIENSEVLEKVNRV
eukprot:TRINITY_DN34091_c0_g1_i1.p2 TRINITY_DN34091_c0_g1~~TRINITY_DN34091_c0_g1_i1.p2  ORF type:complete len:146 (-),score=60.19 TRINITY_DN34091_c0_g1_i1:86-502(-)